MILFDDYYRTFWTQDEPIDDEYFGYIVNRAISDSEIAVNRITDITISLCDGKSFNSLTDPDGERVGNFVKAPTTRVHIVISGDE